MKTTKILYLLLLSLLLLLLLLLYLPPPLPSLLYCQLHLLLLAQVLLALPLYQKRMFQLRTIINSNTHPRSPRGDTTVPDPRLQLIYLLQRIHHIYLLRPRMPRG